MSDIDINPKLHYLVARITQTVEDLIGGEPRPVAVVPLTSGFFDWMDRRRELAVAAHDLNCMMMSFNFVLDFADLDVFDPDHYSPDGEADIPDTEEFKKKLAPLWQSLEDNQYVVVKGDVLVDLGLDPLETVEDFITANEFCTLYVSKSWIDGKKPETWPRNLSFTLDVELKHSYEPWDTVQVNYDELRQLYREEALAEFKVRKPKES